MQLNSKYFFEQLILRRKNKVDLLNSYLQAVELSGIVFTGDHELSETQNTIFKLIEEINISSYKLENTHRLPAYHNQQHFADAVLAMGFFLKNIHNFSSQEKLILITTMLVHDFAHNGKVVGPEEISHEENTIKQLESTAFSQLPIFYKDAICKFILGTKPSELKINYQNYINAPSNKTYLMQSLVNDADLAASFIPELTEDLSKLVLNESGNQNPSQFDINKVVSWFKSNYQITTDIAKQYYSS